MSLCYVLQQLLDYAPEDNLTTVNMDKKTTPIHLAVSYNKFFFVLIKLFSLTCTYIISIHSQKKVVDVFNDLL